MYSPRLYVCVFFFNDTATTEIYTLSLHDALPISSGAKKCSVPRNGEYASCEVNSDCGPGGGVCHQFECFRTACNPFVEDRKSTRLNSSPRQYLVCRLLLEKKKSRYRYSTRSRAVV